jgi:hypothetical protein
MGRYVWDGRQWVDAGAARAMARAHTSSAAIISDFSEPLLCHADGKMHGSRSTYDAAVREAGCEIIGRTEARAMARKGAFHGRLGMEPAGATLKRILREAGE